jgi:type 1 glutamine amidotransferase
MKPFCLHHRSSLARFARAAFVLGLLLGSASGFAADTIPAHQVERIFQAAPSRAQAEPKQPRRVLIWNTPAHLMEQDPHKGYCIPYGTAAFEAMARKTKAFAVVVSDDLALYLPENLSRFDAVVMNNSSGPWITPTRAHLERPEFRRHGATVEAVEAVLRQSLLDYVQNGGGLVVIHYAVAANRHWPGFQELMGASFLGHPWNEEIGVRVEEPDHPLTMAFGGADFRLADEIYEYGDPWRRDQIRVLLSLDPTRTNMGVPWIHRPDDDFALAWVTTRGKGRLFVTSFGHRTELFWDPRVLQFYLDGVQFATGDLDAPTEPRPGPARRPVPGTEPVGGLPGFVSLFNGQDLSGWGDDPRIWSVQEGAITGQTTESTRVTENTFLIWKDELEDFELRLRFKLEGGNSGVYFRARKRGGSSQDREALTGMQADFSADGRWTGVIMEYTLREVLAERGERVIIKEQGEREVVGRLGEADQLLAITRPGEWNDYAIVARGGEIQIAINGVKMAELEDRDPRRLKRGWLGLQVHTGPPMRVQFKDIHLRRLK